MSNQHLTQVANPGSTLDEAIGALLEREVNHILPPIAQENGCVYVTAGLPNPKTGRTTLLQRNCPTASKSAARLAACDEADFVRVERGLENLARIEHAERVERLLDSLHHFNRRAGQREVEIGRFRISHAVLA